MSFWTKQSYYYLFEHKFVWYFFQTSQSEATLASQCPTGLPYFEHCIPIIMHKTYFWLMKKKIHGTLQWSLAILKTKIINID